MIDTARDSETSPETRRPLRSRVALLTAFLSLALAWWPLVEARTAAAAAVPVIEEIEGDAGEPLTETNWFDHVDGQVFEGDPISGSALYWYPWRALISVALATGAAFAIASAGWRNNLLVGVAVAAPIVTLLGWLAVAVAYGPAIRVVTMILE